MKTNEVESRATDGSFIEPAHCAVAPEDLSRFEGEGGPEAPVPALALIDVLFENVVAQRPSWAVCQAK